MNEQSTTNRGQATDLSISQRSPAVLTERQKDDRRVCMHIPVYITILFEKNRFCPADYDEDLEEFRLKGRPVD